MLTCLSDLVWLHLNAWLIHHWLLLSVRHWHPGQLLLWLDLLANLRLVILLIVLPVGHSNGLRWLLRHARECRIGFIGGEPCSYSVAQKVSACSLY